MLCAIIVIFRKKGKNNDGLMWFIFNVKILLRYKNSYILCNFLLLLGKG